ncbi:hypothetical protein ACFU5C_36455, partial [Streptomyces sp. NPDC057426]
MHKMNAAGDVVKGSMMLREYFAMQEARIAWEEANPGLVNEASQVRVGPYDGVILDAVGRTMAEFPEFAGRGDEPLTDILADLSPAQLVKFERLVDENGLASVNKDFQEILNDGTLERVLSQTDSTLKELLPPELSSPVVDTPENVVADTPEPAADTPEPAADTPEPAADTPEPAADTPEPGRRMGEAGAPDEVRMMTAIVKSVESLGELAPRGESRLAEVLRDLTPGQLEKFGALMRQNGLEEFGLGARELIEPGGLVDQALAGKDFLVNDFLTMETLVAEVMRTTHPDTTEVPAVPDKPLPERPLPEKPLPERPLPRLPLSEAGGPQSGSTGRVGDLPLGGESASPARQDSGFGEVPLGDAKSPETVARSAPEGVGDVSSGTVGEGSVRSGLPEVTVVAEGSLAEGMSAEIGSVSEGGQGLGGRAGDGNESGGEGDWLDQALGDLRPVPEGEPLSATPDSPGNPALEAFRASAEAFRASMEAFPELPDSVKDLPLVEVLEGLSPAQKIKLGVLLEEHGLADGPAMVESGALRDLLWSRLDTLRNPNVISGGAGSGSGADEALAARVEALRDGERPVEVEGEYGPLPEGELEALLDQAPGVPDGVPSEAGSVRAAEAEAKALRLGMSREEAGRYTERYETALAKGDVEAAGAIAGARDAHVAALERAYGELMGRLGPDAVARAGLEGAPAEAIATAAQARDAGIEDASWNAFEERIGQAVAGGRLAEAQNLILARNELVETLASTTAGEDAVLAARVEALREGDDGAGGERPVDGEGGERPLADADFEALLEGAAAAPEGIRQDVGPGDLRMVEALVTQARAAGVAEGEITAWSERLGEAWSGRGREGESLREAGREWQRELDRVTGRSPDPDALLQSPEATVLTQQETLARAAEEAGVSFEEHAGLMKDIRDAWAQGRTEDADSLVEQFWGRVEEATVQQQAERAVRAEEMMAQARGMTLQEYQAFLQRQDARDTSLVEVLELLVDEGGPGLADQVRHVLDGLGQDYADSPLPRLVAEQLASGEDGTSVSDEALRQGLSELLTPDAAGAARARFEQAMG